MIVATACPCSRRRLFLKSVTSLVVTRPTRNGSALAWANQRCKFSQILNDGPAGVGREILVAEVSLDQGSLARPNRDGAKNIITQILPAY